MVMGDLGIADVFRSPLGLRLQDCREVAAGPEPRNRQVQVPARVSQGPLSITIPYGNTLRSSLSVFSAGFRKDLCFHDLSRGDRRLLSSYEHAILVGPEGLEPKTNGLRVTSSAHLMSVPLRSPRNVRR